jgi:hypothetical protein
MSHAGVAPDMRKNFLFAGADAGGDRAAIAHSMVGSCRLAGVDPQSTSPTSCLASPVAYAARFAGIAAVPVGRRAVPRRRERCRV